MLTWCIQVTIVCVKMSSILHFLQFHCRKIFQDDPAAFAACTCAVLVLTLAIGASSLAQRQHAEKRTQLVRLLGKAPGAASNAAAPAPAALDLPWFDSAQLVEQFSKAAEESKVPLDEVGYVLEESTQHPYLRYRITLSVSASYSSIRQFADSIPAAMRHIDLDSISCLRPDIAVAPLTCDLAFSAFFRRDAHGQ